MAGPEKDIRNIGSYFSDSLKTVNDERLRIGWLCTYTPEEMIFSAGFSPVRILGEERVNKAEGYFPTNFCPFLKSSWECILNDSGRLNAIVFTNSCDGMRRLYDICRNYKPRIPSFMLDVPRINTEASVNYFSNNLSELMNFLSGLGKSKIGPDSLLETIELYNNKRILLKNLNHYYSKYASLVDNQDYFEVLKLAMVTDPETFVRELRVYVDKITEESAEAETFTNGKEDSSKPAIMLIGNFINESALWRSFKDLNCKIVAADLCNSSRYYEGLIEVNETDPEGAIAARYLNKPQCMRMANMGVKLNQIKEDIRQNNIQGVIFISMKFCDNTLLFYPPLRQDLNEAGIQSLFLEIEHNNFSEGQIKTRIQAFLEIL